MERYEKIRVIGQGAFGKVFLLRRKSDRINVVIKQIPVDDLPSDERRASMTEVNVLKMLKHPNIVAYYDSFVEEKSIMIAMEYAPGGTLYELIMERDNQLMLEEHILQLFVQILVAIQHVHSQNILHRDLKPQNIMLNKKRSVVKIGDFGISKVLSSKITSAQTVIGTPCYISPEICEGKPYRKKSDIWALGCILYELTTLKKAFEGANLPALVFKIMQAVEGIKPIDKKYSQGLQHLIGDLIQRNPDDRPNTENIMGRPVLVNALVNLGTDVGRLPCTRPKDHNQSSVGIRMGSLGGSHRQKSFFDHDDYEQSYKQDKSKDAQPKSKSQVYMWGGGLGLPLKLPVLQSDCGRVVSVSCGRSLKMGVTDDGKLIKWELCKGNIATSGLTISSHTRRNDTIQFISKIVESSGSNILIEKACCGDMYTVCLTDKGIVMTFGSGVNGCLGHGNYEDVSKFELVAKTLEYETIDIACGSNHVLSLTADNTLFAWGRGESGQLGTGTLNSFCIPQQIDLPKDLKVKTLVCGPDSSIIITTSLAVFATGSNKYNKLGLDHIDDDNQQYNPTSAHDRISDVTETSIIMSSVFKSITDSTPSTAHTPNDNHIEKVAMFAPCQSNLINDITDASISHNHAAYINVSGKCITAGYNGCGQLGRTGNGMCPGIVDVLQDRKVKLISCGDAYTTACTTDNNVYTWGQSKRGRLGRDTDNHNIGTVQFECISQIHSISSSQDVTLIVISD